MLGLASPKGLIAWRRALRPDTATLARQRAQAAFMRQQKLAKARLLASQAALPFESETGPGPYVIPGQSAMGGRINPSASPE